MRILPITGALALTATATLLIPFMTGARADEPTVDPRPVEPTPVDPPPVDPPPADAAPVDAPPVEPPPVEPPPGPPLDQIYIQTLSYGGTGCPAGTVDLSLSADGTAFSMRFNAFTAILGPGISIVESRKNCQVNTMFHVPAGWTYALTSVDQSGYLELADGAQAKVKTIAYFQGQVPQSSAWTTFTGPLAMDWHVRDEVPLAGLVWAPCGVPRGINVNASVQVAKGTSAPGTTSFVNVAREGLDQHYSLVWKRCEAP